MSTPSESYSPNTAVLITELLKRSRAEHKSMRRFFWVLLSVFGVAVILISVLSVAAPKFTEAAKNEGDFLRVAIPVIVVALGFGITFLGLKRLEQFDNEINLLRVSLSSQLLEERKLAAEERKQLQFQLDKKLGDVSADIKNRTEGIVAETIRSKYEEMSQRAEAFISTLTLKITEADSKFKPYQWLKQHESELDRLSSMNTIGYAHRTATTLAMDGNVDLASRVMREALERGASGDSDNYHNLSVVAAQLDDYQLAASITDAGLQRFPKSIDLLADGLCYHAKYGNLERCHELSNLLKQVPMTEWSWRAFTFLADYFIEAGQVPEAMKVYNDYQRCLPMEDKAYSSHGRYHVSLGQHDQAISVLKRITTQQRRCPQSASILCEVYLQLAQYQDAVEAADLAIEGCSEFQPSVNITSLLMNRASARDGLLHSKLSPSQIDKEIDDTILHLAQLCIDDYLLVLRIKEGLARTPHLVQVVPVRLEIIKSLLRRCGVAGETLNIMFSDTSMFGGDTQNHMESLMRILQDSSDMEQRPQT